jgi:hypothetical protein
MRDVHICWANGGCTAYNFAAWFGDGKNLEDGLSTHFRLHGLGVWGQDCHGVGKVVLCEQKFLYRYQRLSEAVL